jgi:hypothetical protein
MNQPQNQPPKYPNTPKEIYLDQAIIFPGPGAAVPDNVILQVLEQQTEFWKQFEFNLN